MAAEDAQLPATGRDYRVPIAVGVAFIAIGIVCVARGAKHLEEEDNQ